MMELLLWKERIRVVTHIDMAKSKFAFNKFTLEELARVLKVSYGLARKYALEWLESAWRDHEDLSELEDSRPFC